VKIQLYWLLFGFILEGLETTTSRCAKSGCQGVPAIIAASKVTFWKICPLFSTFSLHWSSILNVAQSFAWNIGTESFKGSYRCGILNGTLQRGIN